MAKLNVKKVNLNSISLNNPSLVIIIFIFIMIGIAILQGVMDNAASLEIANTTVSDTILKEVGDTQTLSQTPLSLTSINSKNRTWLDFDGSADYIATGYSQEINANHSYSFWTNFSYSDATPKVIARTDNSGEAIYIQNGALTHSLLNTTSGQVNNTITGLNDSNWNYVVITINKTVTTGYGVSTVYVNGVFKNATNHTDPSGLLAGASPLNISTSEVEETVETIVTNHPIQIVSNDSAGNTAWSTPGQGNFSDNTFATFSEGVGFNSEYLIATNFSFNLPADAVVNGIKVEVERNSTNTGVANDLEAKILKGYSIGTVNLLNATDWGQAEVVSIYSNLTYTWGETWTAADINSPGFGFVFRVDGSGPAAASINVDAINITINYTSDVGSSFEGSIDEFKVYNVTLASAQVTNLYNAGRVQNQSLENGSLINYYGFNENSGTLAHNLINETRNGTITGASWANDNINVSLNNNADYSLATDVITILNPIYSWNEIVTVYDYDSSSSTNVSSLIRIIGIVIAIILMGLAAVPTFRFIRERL